MKNMIKNILISITAMLAVAGVANAATVSLTPSDSTIALGDPLSLTAGGTGFDTDVSSGSIVITWEESSLALQTTATDIAIDLLINGFTFANPADFSTAGTLSIDFFAAPFGGVVAGPSFELFNLDFIAIPPPTVSSLTVNSFPTSGFWQDGNNNALDGLDGRDSVNYAGATVTVSAVPVPAAVWLFGSGLLGMVGVARRRIAS